MQDVLTGISSIFEFFNNITIADVSLTLWIVIIIILGGIGFIIRGNK